jgi:hypothetical protein
MPEPFFLSAIAGILQAALSDAAKESVKAWLTDAVRVKRAIQKTAFTFSTRVHRAEDALSIWIGTDAFRSAMEDLVAGRAFPENLAVDQFLDVTGLGFGSASRDVVRDMLAAFYGNIREDWVSSRQGLVLVDNRVGETLRQVAELRADLASGALSGLTKVGVQRISAEFLKEIAQRQGWGPGLHFGAELYVNIEPPPAVQNLAKRAVAVVSVRTLLGSTAWYGMHGGSGSGKTQLAILITGAFAGPKLWIRLAGPASAAALVIRDRGDCRCRA